MTSARACRLLAETRAAFKRGWVLVPIMPASKRPATPWRDRAPFAVEELLRFVGNGCRAAVRTGSPRGYRDAPCGGGSGIVVIDADVYAGALVDPSWPTTWTVATPRGGEHHYYGWKGADVIPSRTSVLGPHIDVRGRGGIALLPGSGHPGGGRYRWVAGRSPKDIPMAPLPTSLVERLREKPPPSMHGRVPPCVDQWIDRGRFAGYARAALQNAAARVAAAADGTRNDVLNREAFGLARLVGAGVLSADVVTGVLCDAARSAGLHDREIGATVQSALRAGTGRPIDLVILDARRRLRRRGGRRRGHAK